MNFLFFQVRNTRTVNRTGQLTGYKLVPGPNCLPLAGPEAKFLRRAAFLKHNLWVTQYAAGEDFPGGEFPNQNPRVGEGLASWVKEDRSLEESDIVLWLVSWQHSNLGSNLFVKHPCLIFATLKIWNFEVPLE